MASLSDDSLSCIVTSSSSCNLSCYNIDRWSLTSHTAQTVIWLCQELSWLWRDLDSKTSTNPTKIFSRDYWALPRGMFTPLTSLPVQDARANLDFLLFFIYTYFCTFFIPSENPSSRSDQISEWSEKTFITIGHLKTIENGTILLTLTKVSAECRDKSWAVLWEGLKKQIK